MRRVSRARASDPSGAPRLPPAPIRSSEHVCHIRRSTETLHAASAANALCDVDRERECTEECLLQIATDCVELGGGPTNQRAHQPVTRRYGDLIAASGGRAPRVEPI